MATGESELAVDLNDRIVEHVEFVRDEDGIQIVREGDPHIGMVLVLVMDGSDAGEDEDDYTHIIMNTKEIPAGFRVMITIEAERLKT